MCAAATAVRRDRSANAVDVWLCVFDGPFTVVDRDRETDDRLRLLHAIEHARTWVAELEVERQRELENGRRHGRASEPGNTTPPG